MLKHNKLLYTNLIKDFLLDQTLKITFNKENHKLEKLLLYLTKFYQIQVEHE
jgi:hypothetical protein